MLEKLSFYDLLGYLVPGGTVVALGYWLVFTKTIVLNLPSLPGDLALAAVLLATSYAAGHLVQGFAELMEHRLIMPAWRRRDRAAATQYQRPGPPLYSAHTARAFFANQLLSESRDGYPGPVVELILAKATAAGFPGARHPHVVSPKQLFDLCQATIVGDAAERSGIFLAISGLSRGMLAASVIGVLVAIAVALDSNTAKHGDATAFIVLVFFALTGVMWYRRYRRFSWYFADAIWTGFAAAESPDSASHAKAKK